MDSELRINDISTVPPDGWYYIQKETQTRINGNDFLSLRRAVIIHRHENKIPIGTIDADIHNQICERIHPTLCKYKVKVKSEDLKIKYNIKDVKNFVSAVSDTIKNGGVVSQEEASRRATICARCPFNKTIAGCYGCAGIANTVFSFLGSRQHGQEGFLKQCAKCGCYLDAKVWVPLEAQPDAPDMQYPTFCWMSGADKTNKTEIE